MNKKIEISTLNVSIRILTLDNKRFTKSIYKQLPKLYFYPNILSWNEITILGFVVDDSFAGKSFLINKEGILHRVNYPHFNNTLGNTYHNNVSSFQEFSECKTIIESYGQIFITS